MRLTVFQDLFQSAILGQDCEVLSYVDETPSFDRFERLKVYVGAYRLRHAEFVARDFPILREALGDQEFESLALDYIAQNPSREVNARRYACELPEFMARHPKWSRLTGPADLARLERALADAFDAANAPVAQAAHLLAFDAGKAHLLTLRFHPSVAVLKACEGTRAIFLAALEGAGLPGWGEGEERALVWRRAQNCFHRSLDEAEGLALTLAMEGLNFGALCSALRQSVSADRMGSFLLHWLGDGLISRIMLGETREAIKCE